MNSSPLEEERRRREEAERRLREAEEKLRQYEEKLHTSEKNMSSLTGSFKKASLSNIAVPHSTPGNVLSTASRKASEIFRGEAKSFKQTLLQLILSGDQNAKRLLESASPNNKQEILTYVQQKMSEKKDRQKKIVAQNKPKSKHQLQKEKDLEMEKARFGMSSSSSPSFSPLNGNGMNGYRNAADLSHKMNLGESSSAASRFANKRERPESYQFLAVPPDHSKPKFISSLHQQQPPPPPLPLPTQKHNSQQNHNQRFGQTNNAQSPQQNPSQPGLINFDLLNSNSTFSGGSLPFNLPNLNISNFSPNQPQQPSTQLNGLLLQQLNQLMAFNKNFPNSLNSANHNLSVGNNNLGSGRNDLSVGNGHANLNGVGYNNGSMRLPMGSVGPTVDVNSLHFMHRQQQAASFMAGKNVGRDMGNDESDSDDGNDGGKTPRRWTEEEDHLLLMSVNKHGARNWKKIATEVPGRNHVQCLQRWRKALDPGVVKGHWSPEEDEKLLKLVEEKPKNWGHVARGITGRTAKQCRERYHNHLDPSIKKGDWSLEEDETIVRQQKELGNKWADIAKKLEGRTENSVKIRWKSIKRQVLALKDENGLKKEGGDQEKEEKKKKSKRNTMDKERLNKLLNVWQEIAEK